MRGFIVQQLGEAYLERVYAGLLGKLIGVYLGRPFEGWEHDRIVDELGEITYFIHEKLGLPLVVADDDIAGTLTFLRALPDNGNTPELSAKQVGETWLNYLVEGRSTLWWGGRGNSTEHTAYLNLKAGVPAPESGSATLNGSLVAEQIGAQIFIDGWAMVAPGRPALAVRLAEQAARVSHDGEAVNAARMLAALESQAFIESDIGSLIDLGLTYVPPGSLISKLVQDVRTWASQDGDWHTTRSRIERLYGPDSYDGNAHVIPNHAIIILSLLYSDGDFGRALTIANTSGWDTDCNSGNVGCFMAIRGGLEALEGVLDWRGPVADRLFVSSADGGRSITDAVRESIRIADIGRALAHKPPLAKPKAGARFHFALPGSVQGFRADDPAAITVTNVSGRGSARERSLALQCAPSPTAESAHVGTATFVPPEMLAGGSYELLANPTLHPGQVLAGVLHGDEATDLETICTPYLRAYDADDDIATIYGTTLTVPAGSPSSFEWTIPEVGGGPIFQVGIAVRPAATRATTVYLDHLTWTGVPNTIFKRPSGQGVAWLRAWVDAVDRVGPHWPRSFHMSQDRGRGMLILGGDWQDFEVTADVCTYLAKTMGLAIRVQGLERYYALLFVTSNTVRLIKRLGSDHVLAEQELAWSFNMRYSVRIEVIGARIRAWVDGAEVFDVTDKHSTLAAGGIGLVCGEGMLMTDAVSIAPARTNASPGRAPPLRP